MFGAIGMNLNRCRQFWLSDLAQGLSEYSLLVAFLMMLGLALFLAVGGNTHNIWNMSTSQLASADSATSTTTTTGTATSGR
jgi:hypothetical protein